jgi:hypothetical protein
LLKNIHRKTQKNDQEKHTQQWQHKPMYNVPFTEKKYFVSEGFGKIYKKMKSCFYSRIPF